MDHRRVVITGIGLVTPLGIGHEEVWDNLLKGACGTAPVRAFSTHDYPATMGGEVRGFDPVRYLRRQHPEQMGRASQMAVASALMALQDAELAQADDLYRPHRCGVVMGTTSGEPLIVEQYNDALKAGRVDAFADRLFTQYPCSTLAHRVADELLWTGGALTIPNACAAGNFAIGYARDLILGGRLDMALAGGSDAFSRIPYAGFGRLGAIAPDLCRPFDRDRQGMIPGEGAATLVLESGDSARRRGARIYAEVLACGASCDAHHMTAGHPDGDGAVRAIEAALLESGLDPDDIDYICAHGTGTPTNDRIESRAVHRVFGERARKLPMSSIKSMMGHTMGAASAIEAAACALAIHTGEVPPTINFQTPDPDCPIDCVPNTARRVNPKVVLNNAYAFGGTNASLCLRQWDPPSRKEGRPSMKADLSGIAVTGMGVITHDSDLDPKAVLGGKGLRVLDRPARLLACAAKFAVEDAHLGDLLAQDPSSIGLVNGTLVGGLQSIADFDRSILEDSPRFVNPAAFAATVINAPAGQTAIKLGLQGLNSTITSGMTSSLTAIAYAAQALRAGRARALLAGGTEEASTYAQEAQRRLTPNGQGGGVAEGAAMLALQPLSQSKRPLAIIAGYGQSCGTPETPSVDLLAQAVTGALQEAGLESADIDLILAVPSKSSTLKTQLTSALRSIFPDTDLPIQYPSPDPGNALGATPALVTAQAVKLFSSGSSPNHILIPHLTCDRQSAALILTRAKR
ncbi:MAG TPA: beta-ketoacyl-[acyl-carrier-protein] synthase family protein [Acidobacteriota bacterium]|nr:beta-ketoacyl-[acyl-carrier-protein] synthase family protein [Acidobacteriota bacterium]